MSQATSRKKRARYPSHEVTYEVVECPLDAPTETAHEMHRWLDVLCDLRETLRLQRASDRDIGRQAKAAGLAHKYLSFEDQRRYLASRAKHELADIHSQVLQDVAERVHKGTVAWMRGDAGALRFQHRKHYRSFNFPQYGFAVKIRNGFLHMSHLGKARLVALRRLPGRPKAVRLVFKEGRWFAQFTCEVQVQHCPRVRRHASAAVKALPDTGADTGLARNLTTAHGDVFEPAKPLKKAIPRLCREQRNMSRQFEARKKAFAAYKADFKARELHGPLPDKNHFPLSNRLRRQIRCVAILHTRIGHVRRDQLRKIARTLEQRYRMIAVEEHSLVFMQKNRRQSRTVADVAPGLLKQCLKQAFGPDRYVPVANQRPGIGGNSQTCTCDAKVPKELSDRWHTCSACGLSADRDVVSANIAMKIAFGFTVIEAPAPGQGVVKRGEGEWGTGASGPLSTQNIASEPSVKRQSSRRKRPIRNTAGVGIPATAEVNNLQFFGVAQAPPLSG